MLRLTRILRGNKLFVHKDTPNNNPSISFQFNEENKVKAAKLIKQYPEHYEKGAMIPLLDLAQRQNDNFLSIGCMNHVADVLKVPPMRVYEVATFYTMFNREPVGKFHVQVCTTTPCELCGSAEVVKALKEELAIGLGETTKDNSFTLNEVECAGACVNAPVMAVNDDYFEDLTPQTAVDILRALKAGKKVTTGPSFSYRQGWQQRNINRATAKWRVQKT